MASILRLRKLLYLQPAAAALSCSTPLNEKQSKDAQSAEEKKHPRKENRGRGNGRWGCVDSCCWAIGYACSLWWVIVFLYSVLPSALPSPEPPGLKLRREGLLAHHPVVLVPGIVTGGLELWEGRPCSDGLFRKRLWGGSFTEIFRRPLCWLEHMSLDNETGLDPPGIRVRAVPGLVAADYFAPGYFVWAMLIENLARIGYEGKNMHMTSYDWRLSFQNTEVRDQSLSRLKSKMELMLRTNGGRKLVVVPHSMGSLYFLHFMKWVETPDPRGGGGGPDWCSQHIRAVMNIGPTFLGVPKAVTTIFSAEARDIASVRAMAPGVLDSSILGLQTLQHMMRVSRTWDSIHSLLPKGGEAIWGGLDWSPEEGFACDPIKKKYDQDASSGDGSRSSNASDVKLRITLKEVAHYGRIISFGKKASQMPSSELIVPDSKRVVARTDTPNTKQSSCGDMWTEYDEMIPDSIQTVAKNNAYTAGTVHDLLQFVAPKLMRRADTHFSYGIAEDFDDPKYSHYKHWSNPLEMRLPDAPEMEMYCLYGVGIPTERSYVYKVSPSDRCNSIPFQIDSSADGGDDCLRGGVYFTDGDESVPVLSAGFMCAKGWRGKTRFNPSGMVARVREYPHKPPANLLEGRGYESGAHVDIMGNAALIEDVMRLAAGSDVGGDRIHSDVMKMSERVRLRV